MKKIIFVVIIFVQSLFAFSENLPKFYYEFGTERNQIIFEMGEPKLFLTDGHLLYENYSGVSTLETLVFYIDENQKLFGITIDIGIDYGTPIPKEELQNRVFNYYKELFISIYGKPFIANEIGLLWKYDDGFCVFQPYVKDTFLRFKYFCFPKELAKDTEYGSIYE